MKRFLFMVVLLTSCLPGRIAYRDGEREVVVRNVDNPAGDVTMVIAPDGSVGVTIPGEHAPASYTEKATVNGLMILGGAFAVIAVLLFVFKARFPLMPSNAPVGCALASAACFTLPTIIQEYKTEIAIGAGLWLVWIWYSYKHNERLKNES